MGSPEVPLVNVIRQGSLALSSTAGGGLGGEQRLVGHEHDASHRAGRLELCAVALVGDTSDGPAAARRRREVLGAQLLGAGQHDRAEAKAGAHRQDPLGAVADERHHDVAPAARRAAFSAPARRALRSAISRERPLTPLAVARELDQGEACGRWRSRTSRAKFTPVFSLRSRKRTGQRPWSAETNGRGRRARTPRRPTSRRRSPRWCASSPTSRSCRTPSTTTTRTPSPSRSSSR